MTRTILAVTVACACLAVAQGQTVTQADLLARVIDLDRLTQPLAAGERTLLFSSWDRASKTIKDGKYTKWDADGDSNQFLGKSKDGWDIWASIEGPSAATRIWCDKLAGEFQILVDEKKVASGTLSDLFTGAVAPFGEPLTYVVTGGELKAGVSYFPIACATSLVIQTRGFDGAYQIDVLKFAPGTQVASFTADLNAAALRAVEDVSKTFKNGLTEKRLFTRKAVPAAADDAADAAKPKNRARVGSYGEQADLKPKQKITVQIPPPPPEKDKAKSDAPREASGTIRALYLALTDKFEPRDKYALHNLALRITFDDAKQPQIEAPLVDFFGTGFMRNRFNGLAIGTERLVEDFPGEVSGESVFMYCFFPMPFRKKAVIEVENMNVTLKTPIGVMLYVKVDTAEPAKDSLVFNARFRQENPCKTFDYPLLETAGRGRVVGCVVNVDCPQKDWWGAGDHKAWIDGETFPSIWGTGTADYFGNVKGLGRFVRPLHGATAVTIAGKNSCFRFHTLDAIEFSKSIKLALENWQIDRAAAVMYGTVTYWYGEAGVEPKNFDRLEADDLKLMGLRIPGAVEIEGNIEGKDWGNVVKQRDIDGGRVELSGEAAATIATTETITVIVRPPKAGTYLLKLRTVPGLTFDTVEVADAPGKPIGTVKYEKRPDWIFEVGRVELTAGENKLKVRCTAKPTKLDCWILEPVK